MSADESGVSVCATAEHQTGCVYDWSSVRRRYLGKAYGFFYWKSNVCTQDDQSNVYLYDIKSWDPTLKKCIIETEVN